MKIKILEKKDQPLMYRQELTLEVEFDNEVPSRKFLMEQVAKATKSAENLVIVDKIESNFGTRVADVHAYIYVDEKKMESFVRGYMKKRHQPSEAELKALADKKAAKEAEAEAPKEEAEVEAPKAEAEVEAPKAEAEVEAPKEEAKAEAPNTENSVKEAE